MAAASVFRNSARPSTAPEVTSWISRNTSKWGSSQSRLYKGTITPRPVLGMSTADPSAGN